MLLRLTFSSSPFASSELLHEMLTRYDQCGDQDGLQSLLGEPLQGNDPTGNRLTVTFQAAIEFGQTMPPDQAIRRVILAVQFFSDCADRYQTAWHVADQHEPDLGKIEPAGLNDRLIEELKTAVSAAHSLSGLIVDDEFIEPESTFAGGRTQDDDGSDFWNGLIDCEDEFIRFREFDS